MKVHVTGGSGFLGGRVVPLLVARGHEVSALARSAHAAEKVEHLGATAVAGDLDDPASVDAAFSASGAEALVNLASLGFGHAPTIVAAAEEAGLSRAVFVSTTAIFTSLDARSKAVRLAAEETIRASGLKWTILRPTMIYGAPGDRNMARLLRLLRRAPVVPLPGGGGGLQQPVHVDDLAATVVAALEAPEAMGREYAIAGPEPMALRDVVAQSAAAVGRAPKMFPVPLGPVIAAVRLYERVSGCHSVQATQATAVPTRDRLTPRRRVLWRSGGAVRLRLRAEQIERLAEDKAFDIGPARRDLGFAPRSFAAGIREEAACPA